MAYVYIWSDPKTSIERYVGWGKTATRSYVHIKNSHNARLESMLHKRKREGFELNPVINEHVPSEKSARAIEIFWIAVFGRLDQNTGTLFNRTIGGEGGLTSSSEHLAKITTDLWKDEEYRNKTVAAMKRKRQEHPELNEAVGAYFRGKPQSPEHVALKAARKCKPCTVDNITIYPSLKALVAALGQGYKGKKHPDFHYIKDMK
jgi:hypothetical protein